MREAIERCKRLLQVTLASHEALSEKRVRACAELEILVEQIAAALPDDEQAAIKEVLQLYAQLWSSPQ